MEFKQELGIVTSGEVTSDMVKAQLERRHLEMWKGKPLHGYLPTKIEKDEEIDDRATAEWMNTGLSSHVEGYTAALQEQETATRATIKRRTEDGNLLIKCRLCEDKDETVFHVLCSCPKLSANLYTTARHDHVGEVLLNEIIKDHQQRRINLNDTNEGNLVEQTHYYNKQSKAQSPGHSHLGQKSINLYHHRNRSPL